MTTCTAALNIAGQGYRCDLDAPHPGLAHANETAQAIWCSDAEADQAEHPTPRNRAAAIRRVMRSPQQCHAEVTRKGEIQPCNKPAAAIRLDPDYGDLALYPVCKHHTAGEVVPLTDTLAALTQPNP